MQLLELRLESVCATLRATSLYNQTTRTGMQILHLEFACKFCFVVFAMFYSFLSRHTYIYIYLEEQVNSVMYVAAINLSTSKENKT